ncbi:uncharacterized protein LAJ45_11129 [Morchella importuna]|uniref:uncharacterized protein n=1 Tax=Morchella importuna TaxID=1174673 RepID=UPI001E8EB809|nr:uncharacterized protein LAJ45_11129 [Morchella importuna]KAH8144859.1 hypothetical protein LAJ45_11129 [Morchella importuna]
MGERLSEDPYNTCGVGQTRRNETRSCSFLVPGMTFTPGSAGDNRLGINTDIQKQIHGTNRGAFNLQLSRSGLYDKAMMRTCRKNSKTDKRRTCRDKGRRRKAERRGKKKSQIFNTVYLHANLLLHYHLRNNHESTKGSNRKNSFLETGGKAEDLTEYKPRHQPSSLTCSTVITVFEARQQLDNDVWSSD